MPRHVIPSTLTALLLAAALPLSAQESLAECRLEGRWTLPDGVGQVEFRAVEGRWVGVLATPPEDAPEQVRLGWEMVRDIEVNEGEDRYDARLHPNADRSVNAEIRCLEDGRLEVKGKRASLRRTMHWVRAESGGGGAAP